MAPSPPNPDAIFDALIQNRNDPAALRKRVETLEILLERSFVIPGINRPVGLDAIVGLVPVVGDVIAATMGAYLIWEARNLGMPKWKIWRDGRQSRRRHRTRRRSWSSATRSTFSSARTRATCGSSRSISTSIIRAR